MLKSLASLPQLSWQSAEPRPTVTLGEVMSEPGPLQGKQTATLQQFPSFQFMAGKARGSVSDSGSAKPLPQVNSNRSASGPSEGEEKIIRVERLSDTGVSTVSSSPQLDLGVPSRIFIEHSDRNSPSTKHTSDPDSSKLSIMSYETTGAGAKLVGLDALVEHARIHRSIRIMQSHNSDLYSGPENSSEPFDGQRSPKSGRTPGASDARLQRIDDNEDSQSPQGRDANPFALPPHGIADPASAGTVSLLLVAEDPSPPPPPAQPTYTSSSSMGHDGYPPRLPSSMSEPYALSPGPFLTTKVSTTSFFSQNSLVATPSLIRQASLNRQRKVVHPAMSILHVSQYDAQYHIMIFSHPLS